MPRICEIHRVDNGLLIQVPATEGRDGIMIANSGREALELVVEVMNANGITVVSDDKPKIIPMTAPAPEQKLPSGAPLPPGVPPPTPSSVKEEPAEQLDYEGELRRIVTEDDRPAIKARADAHVAAGRLTAEDIRKKGVKKLVDLVRAADKKVAKEEPEANTVGAPAITKMDVATTLGQVAGRSVAAQAAVKELLTAYGVERVSDLKEEQYAGIIADAKAITA